MVGLIERIRDRVKAEPGLTDRELTDRILGTGEAQQSINQTARTLESRGEIRRSRGTDGRIRNYPAGDGPLPQPVSGDTRTNGDAVSWGSEDEVKRALRDWLESQGWSTKVAWGKAHGVDIEASRDGKRWLIEVKGSGSMSAMRVNYFLQALSEVLQRMKDPEAEYSIAFPELGQFQRLWERLPRLAKSRTGITAIFVDKQGNVAVRP